jgi:hypothetical protein
MFLKLKSKRKRFPDEPLKYVQIPVCNTCDRPTRPNTEWDDDE